MSTVDNRCIAHAESTDGTVTAFNRRAPRISQADVFQTADELLVEGHRPTIDRVRVRLGRGSPNTINDHLDAWWAKLGARLRDLPGHEFPQLPERVARTLQQLWNEALTGAHEALQTSLLEREHSLGQREATLQERTRQFAEHEQAATVRAAALEESLTLAREQLTVANQRAKGLEATLQERNTEGIRLREKGEELEHSIADLRMKLDATETAHQAERTRLEERHATAEARWLTEVDRTRQVAKDAAKEHERQLKALRSQIEGLQREREGSRQQLVEARSELKAANAVRKHLEEQLRRLQDIQSQRQGATSSRKSARRAAKTASPR